ncbi:uncharacterized protein [Maniola hyperantus]|uniref:uncharacterized protein n=1 Tax=Aphantopus hyperantus TaxID=2795564 RepID=UPI001568EE1B|nr:uncharacterized protein LOC117986822 [Maniola hyperantus]
MSILPYFLLFVVTVQGLPLQNTEDIPEINIYRLHTFDPAGFSITWHPVKTKNYSNPIIGIKVKVWKTPCVMSTVYSVNDGILTSTSKYDPQTYNMGSVPNLLPEYVVIVRPEEVTATIPHIDRETWYHIRALAFTATAEGKYSNPMDFKLNSNDEADKKNTCEKLISETAARSVFSDF